MKEQFKKVSLINLCIIGIGMVIGVWAGGVNALLIELGVVLLLIALGNLLFGFFVAVFSAAGSDERRQGQAMLLMGAISLLCSFTLCSTFW